MILAAAHPYYLADIAFFYKLLRSDVFVVTDTLRYSTRSHLNRARIKTASGAQWLSVPILTTGRTGQRTDEVEIDSLHQWQRNHWRSIFVNYVASPYFERYADTFIALFSQKWHYLVSLATESILLIAHELSIATKIHFLSEFYTRTERSEKVVDLLQTLECDTYLVTPQEQGLIDEKMLEGIGAHILRLQFEHPLYHQQFGDFIYGLSVLDLIMNEGHGARELLDTISSAHVTHEIAKEN